MNYESSECEGCGQPLPIGYFNDLCQGCDEERTDQEREWQEERDLEQALSCRCGAYGISKKTGRPYHCADCVCGA